MIKLISFKDYIYVDGGVCAAKGFKAGGVCCGLRHEGASEEKVTGKNDLAAIYAECSCSAAAVYTTNKVKGAPILVTKKHLEDGNARAVIVNSVNANCCNKDGEEKAEKMCALLAEALDIDENDVIVASTGVIGQTLPIEPIASAMDNLVQVLSEDGNDSACNAIMTTDTFPKQLAVEFKLGDKKCRIGGMIKGSGMIHPNMATTLTFLTTDCAISSDMLHTALLNVIKKTLNCVSVDGDTSTNDMVCVMASGLSGNKPIRDDGADYHIFENALFALLLNFARYTARDGEGATRLIECAVLEAENEDEALTVAKSVIMSSLFKAAMFGGDANWGRILCAIGYSGADIEPEKISVTLSSTAGRLLVCKDGAGVPFSEEEAKKLLEQEEIRVTVTLGRGTAAATAWGCDLTYNYVKINGDYRS